MPGTQFPDKYHDTVNTTRSTYLEIPQHSADREASPHRPHSPRLALSPSPQPGLRRTRKRAKNVHWDSSVVDNEHKMQSRPKNAVAAVHPRVASVKPSEHATSFKSPTANTPVKINPSHSRLPSGYNFVQSRRPLSPVSAGHSRAPGHQPTHGANSSSKLVSSQKKSPTKVARAPPAVPDAPRAHRPPPAPRPARLPTPDLPEIDEAKFFVPKDKLFDLSRGRSEYRGRPIHQKPDNQLEAAIVYMQERKRRGY